MDKYDDTPRDKNRCVMRYTDYKLAYRQIDALRAIVVADSRSVPARAAQGTDLVRLIDVDDIIRRRNCIRVSGQSARSLIALGLVEYDKGDVRKFVPTEEGKKVLVGVGDMGCTH